MFLNMGILITGLVSANYIKECITIIIVTEIAKIIPIYTQISYRVKRQVGLLEVVF